MSSVTLDQLTLGLLLQFSSLKELEATLTQLLIKQTEMLDKGIKELDNYQSDEEIAEISLMVIAFVFSLIKFNVVNVL